MPFLPSAGRRMLQYPYIYIVKQRTSTVIKRTKFSLLELWFYVEGFGGGWGYNSTHSQRRQCLRASNQLHAPAALLREEVYGTDRIGKYFCTPFGLDALERRYTALFKNMDSLCKSLWLEE